ncbi:Glutamine dumper 1 [Heracleum sosnowskyi]|uniref:Glutamine dumper 1 n=1 Tax=Heracleum sosnowskyi TaxID=360622 RepID=A0AAD8HS89_9APIA|nr:Glutamine dumper 1 [Heracleum sosnowskyi]
MTTTTKTTFSPPATVITRSPWNSPVPYLFGGLAAMLGLIVFALLILACSYWKLSGRMQEENDRDLEVGDHKPENSSAKDFPVVFEEKIVVIMAGDVKPTFLATPMCSNKSALVEKVENKEDKNERETVPEPKKLPEQQTQETGNQES